MVPRVGTIVVPRVGTHLGVQAIPDAEDCYRVVYGAHRVAAVEFLQQPSIVAYVLPAAWTEDECLLAELQENSARNDLTGAQRKAYAGEIGRLLAKLTEDGLVANGKNNWLEEMAKTSGTPYRTLYNWWNTFCAEQGLTLAPRQALDIHKQRFFDWLDAQQRQAEEEKARKELEAALRRQHGRHGRGIEAA